jgi:UDPglucose 6-dehydrogenase
VSLKLYIVGTGYLGATHAACMASMGFEVIGVDVDAAKIDLLAQGKVPFYEPDLEDLLAEQIKFGRLKFSKILKILQIVMCILFVWVHHKKRMVLLLI